MRIFRLSWTPLRSWSTWRPQSRIHLLLKFNSSMRGPIWMPASAECVARSLKSAHVPLRVVNREDLNSIAFPGVDAGNAPQYIASITLLLDNPTFQSRLAEAGIRYLAVIGGQTHVGGSEGGIWCGGTPGFMALVLAPYGVITIPIFRPSSST